MLGMNEDEELKLAIIASIEASKNDPGNILNENT